MTRLKWLLAPLFVMKSCKRVLDSLKDQRLEIIQRNKNLQTHDDDDDLFHVLVFFGEISFN